VTAVRLNAAAIRDWAGGAAAEEVLRDLGEKIVADAQRDAPKRTGAGAASIAYEIDHDSKGAVVRVSWDKDHWYMIFAEVGTSKETARPFLRPAAEKHRSL
jgi:HK97 gp10 family phage protein